MNSNNPADEYRAALTSVAVFDQAQRPQLMVSGRDRIRFVHGFCTNDVRGLDVGQGCEAFVTNAKARLLGHVFIFNDGERLCVDSPSPASQEIVPHWSKYRISDDVEFTDQTIEWATLALVGPTAGALLDEVKTGTPPGLLEQKHTTLFGTEVCVRRTDELGLPVYLLVLPRSQLETAWRGLCEAGAIRAGSQAWETLRIEAGFPSYGRDLTDANLAQEAGRTPRAISFQKGCYLGQEPIARILALGHVNQELRLVRLDAADPPPAGTELFDAKDPPRVVGRLTSAVNNLAGPGVLALGMLRREHGAAGHAVQLSPSLGSAAGKVVWPPLRP